MKANIYLKCSGPCTIAEPHAVKYNPHSWNNNANIFFIDQPVGVGMSYHDLGPDHGTVCPTLSLLFRVWTDDTLSQSTTEESAIDIAAFMATFFETFKSFKGRRFHMTGESYGVRTSLSSPILVNLPTGTIPSSLRIGSLRPERVPGSEKHDANQPGLCGNWFVLLFPCFSIILVFNKCSRKWRDRLLGVSKK